MFEPTLLRKLTPKKCHGRHATVQNKEVSKTGCFLNPKITTLDILYSQQIPFKNGEEN